jgi:hypothetical protein
MLAADRPRPGPDTVAGSTPRHPGRVDRITVSRLLVLGHLVHVRLGLLVVYFQQFVVEIQIYPQTDNAYYRGGWIENPSIC